MLVSFLSARGKERIGGTANILALELSLFHEGKDRARVPFPSTRRGGNGLRDGAKRSVTSTLLKESGAGLLSVLLNKERGRREAAQRWEPTIS